MDAAQRSAGRAAHGRRDLRAAHDRIRVWGDPVLREPARPVEVFDRQLRDEAAAMSMIVEQLDAAGLAAPQVGSLRRLIVYRARPGRRVRALVNPRVVWASDETDTRAEACLSLPGVAVAVTRPAAVRVQAAGVDGEPVELTADGMAARVLQHEIDHLDGTLILDRASRADRAQAVRALRTLAR